MSPPFASARRLHSEENQDRPSRRKLYSHQYILSLPELEQDLQLLHQLPIQHLTFHPHPRQEDKTYQCSYGRPVSQSIARPYPPSYTSNPFLYRIEMSLEFISLRSQLSNLISNGFLLCLTIKLYLRAAFHKDLNLTLNLIDRFLEARQFCLQRSDLRCILRFRLIDYLLCPLLMRSLPFILPSNKRRFKGCFSLGKILNLSIKVYNNLLFGLSNLYESLHRS